MTDRLRKHAALFLLSFSDYSHSSCFDLYLLQYFLFLFLSILSTFTAPNTHTHPNSSDCLDIRAARTLLDNDHYAMDKLKRRVLEYLAVRQLKTSLKVLLTDLSVH